jgi:nicotinate-nucleotide adenylyltransferase
MKPFMTMNNELKRVGLLGGTFDPVHNGHLDLAAKTKQLFDLQKVLFVPVSQSPHKLDARPTSSLHRIAMLELALKQKTKFSLELSEVDNGGISYTIETLSRLKERYPDWELFLILGADAFLLMDTWKSFTDILKLCHVLVSTRPGFKLEVPDKLIQALGLKNFQLDNNNLILPMTLNTTSEKTIRLYEIPTQNISSREIRGKVQEEKEIKNLLPLAVDHYIMQHQLYKAESPPTKV